MHCLAYAHSRGSRRINRYDCTCLSYLYIYTTIYALVSCIIIYTHITKPDRGLTVNIPTFLKSFFFFLAVMPSRLY